MCVYTAVELHIYDWKAVTTSEGQKPVVMHSGPEGGSSGADSYVLVPALLVSRGVTEDGSNRKRRLCLSQQRASPALLLRIDRHLVVTEQSAFGARPLIDRINHQSMINDPVCVCS